MAKNDQKLRTKQRNYKIAGGAVKNFTDESFDCSS